MNPIVLSLVAALSIPPGLLPAARNAAQASTALSPSGAPPYVQQVEPAVVGIQAAVPLDRPSVLTLGPVRLGSGVIFDPAGYILTVSCPFNDGERALRGLKADLELENVPCTIGRGVDLRHAAAGSP